VELSHLTHPDLSLLEALTMSSALPGIFMPVIKENKCYVDGGVMCNLPINPCLRDHSDKEEILAIKCSYDNKSDKFENVEVTKESSLLEYVICLTINAMNFIRDTVKIEDIENTVRIIILENPLTLESIQESIKNQDLRRNWIKQGEEDADQFLTQILNKSNQNV
jgi:predicted acylesterase/phospholipase RssA